MLQSETLPARTADAPSYRGHPLWGVLGEIQTDPLDALTRMGALGDAVRFRAGPYPGVLAVSPEAVEHVFVTQARRYGKQTRSYQILRMLVGHGLLTSDGEYWRRQRRIAQPAFHRQRLSVLGEQVTTAAEALASSWPAGARLDVHRELMKLTLRIVGRSLVSREIGEKADEFGDAVNVALHYLDDRMSSLVNVPSWVPTPANRRFAAARETLFGMVDEIIAGRRGAPGQGDLLDLLMAVKDEDTGEGMNDVQLRDELLTILLAGHETSANALAWTLYLLAKNRDTEVALRAELASVLGGRTPGTEDLPKLPLLERVVKESLRLYPPAWGLERSVTEDDQLGAHPVTPRDFILLCPWVTQRLPSIWPDPERFDPDRFLPEREAQRHRFSYYPFGGGNRLCIGQSFALLEVKLVLATLLQRVRLKLTAGHELQPEPLITLRPRGGLPMLRE